MKMVDAACIALQQLGGPMQIADIYSAIISRGLYTFGATRPEAALGIMLRRHCVGVTISTPEKRKYFALVGRGQYALLPKPVDVDAETVQSSIKDLAPSIDDFITPDYHYLAAVHARFERGVRRQMLADLKNLSPGSFENFSKRLIDAYGFKETVVTQASRDGGIDGFGKLEVGLARLNVAFQCKRWRNATVHRPEIDRFRGAIAGKFDQGLFFTTSSFSRGAQEDLSRPGAAPIALFDGEEMVNLMIKHRIGVRMQMLEIPLFNKDEAFLEQ
jgi:restriction system protein